MHETMIIICLVLLLFVELTRLYTDLRIARTNVITHESNLKIHKERISYLENDLKNAHDAILKSSKKYANTAFVISPTGFKFLPENWETQIKWD